MLNYIFIDPIILEILNLNEKLSDLKLKAVLSASEFQILKNDLLKKRSGSVFSNPSIHSNSNSPDKGINLNNKVCPNFSC
jgi:hypothetical protein